MNLNYAIFRSEPIMTIPDLAQIGSHNKREKKAYYSNPDINKELSKNNIELVPLTEKYVKGFDILTKEYKNEYEQRMKTERKSRQRKYHDMLNSSKNCVADELMFTATNTFFNGMSREQIKEWADTCMDFVYKDLGYKKEQILHAVVHLDEKTPHIHCVVVPLVKKLDKRTNSIRYTISKKQYIKDKVHLSNLQDLYHKRLIEKGYDLERGIKESDNKHIKIKEYKKITKKVNQELNINNNRLDKAMKNFEDKMKNTKESFLIGKDFVKVKKDTFDSMNIVINESKKIMELQPKIQNIFNDIDNYSSSYKSLEKENLNYKNEIIKLEKDNEILKKENNSLIRRLNYIIQLLLKFLRKLLLLGNDYTKNEATILMKEYYNNKEFSMNNIIKVSRGTTRQDELFNYVNAPNYYKERVKPVEHNTIKNYDLIK